MITPTAPRSSERPMRYASLKPTRVTGIAPRASIAGSTTPRSSTPIVLCCWSAVASSRPGVASAEGAVLRVGGALVGARVGEVLGDRRVADGRPPADRRLAGLPLGDQRV